MLIFATGTIPVPSRLLLGAALSGTHQGCHNADPAFDTCRTSPNHLLSQNQPLQHNERARLGMASGQGCRMGRHPASEQDRYPPPLRPTILRQG